MLRRTILILTGVMCIMLSCLLNGCRSSKPSTGQSLTENQGYSGHNPEEELKALVGSYRDWNDVAMSVKCNIRSPKSLSISGKVTMIYGREIKLSLRMLGFEVAALYADPDSIYVYEKLNHTMIVEAMSRITSLTGLDLKGVQDMLLGHITNPDNHNDILSGFKKNVSAESITLSMKRKKYDLAYALSRGTDGLTVSSLEVIADGKGSATCRYAPALITPAGPVSPSTDLTAAFGRQKLDASLNWSLETATWNKNIKPNKNLPKGYHRITTDRLIKALGSF